MRNLIYFTMINFTKGVTVDFIRSCWRRITLTVHPDKGGTEESFKAAQNEYESLLQYVKAGFTAESDSPAAYGSFNEFLAGIAPHVAACYKAIYNIAGAESEICGKWIWVKCNNLEALKAIEAVKVAGIAFKYSSKKELHYWAGANSMSKRRYTIEEIRSLYGSKSYVPKARTNANELIEA